MKNTLLTLCLCFIPTFALASNCANLYPNNQEISIPNTTELCNSFYVVRFDETHNIPIISAEVLQPEFTHTKRINDFHPDIRLDANTRAENTDYVHSGFDKGHLTPAEDAATQEQMHDTFLLSNMTPQDSKLNRVNWAHMEELVHKKVVDSGKPVHIITGAVYNTDYTKDTIGKHHISVPVGYYKIVYLPSGTIAYYADNKSTAQVASITLLSLQNLIPFIIQ